MKKQPIKWRVDVGGINEENWVGNELEFETQEEAKAYAHNLLGRWFGVNIARACPVTENRGEIDYNDPTIVINRRS